MSGVDTLAAAAAVAAAAAASASAAAPSSSSQSGGKKVVFRKLKNTDVILGRGSGPNQKSGNIRFREVVWATFQEFLSSQLSRQATASASAPDGGKKGTPSAGTEDSKKKKNQKDGNGDDKARPRSIVIIPEEEYIKPIDAAAKNLIARRVADKMKKADSLFLRKLPHDEGRRLLQQEQRSGGGGAAAAVDDRKKSTKAIVRAGDGSVYIEVTTKETHEKIKQSLRFLVGQKERELKGDDADAPNDHLVGGSKKRKERNVRADHAAAGHVVGNHRNANVSSPPLKKRKARSMTFPSSNVPPGPVLDRGSLAASLRSNRIDSSLPVVNFLSMAARNPASSSRTQSVNWISAGILPPNNSNPWPPAFAPAPSQPTVLSRLSQEEAFRSLMADQKAREGILAAASSTTTRGQVSIQDLQNRQQLEFKLKQEEAAARHHQQERSKMLTELLLQQELARELERKGASQVRSPSSSTQASTGLAAQIHQLEQLHQLRLLDQLRPLPRSSPLTGSSLMEGNTVLRRSSFDPGMFSGRRGSFDTAHNAFGQVRPGPSANELLMSQFASSAAAAPSAPSSGALEGIASEELREFLAKTNPQRTSNHNSAAAAASPAPSGSAASMVAAFLSSNCTHRK